MLLILFFVSLVVFAVTTILPGDAAQMILGQKATPATLAALRVRLGLDQPAPLRYLAWIGGVLRGDWGESLIMNLPVGPLLAQRLGNSAVLALLAWALSAVLGVGLGIVAGLHRNRWPDRLISVLTVFFLSFPPFVIAVFLIIIFSLWLRWLPASSMIEADANLFSSLRFLILPTLTLTLSALAEVARLTRASLIDVLNSDYIRTAKSKGLPSQLIVWRHALRNALLPVISVLALNIGYLMSGTVLVENGLEDHPLFDQAKLRGIRALAGHAETTDVTNDVNGGPSGVGIATAAGKAAFWDFVGAPPSLKVIGIEGEFAMTEGHAQELKTQALAAQVGKRLRILLSSNNAGIDDSLIGGVIDSKYDAYRLEDQWTSCPFREIRTGCPCSDQLSSIPVLSI